MSTDQRLIQKFKLQPHPEGGYYRRTYTSSDQRFSSILFLLTKNNFSAFHKIDSDEQWNWYSGDAIHIHEIDTEGNYTLTQLTNEIGNENFQYVVKSGNWFAAESVGHEGFSLCGCTVIPAFDFSNFELAAYNILLQKYPQHDVILRRFTRV